MEVLLAPSKQQLDKLKTNALETNVIVLLDKEEIARFDLSKKNKSLLLNMLKKVY